MLQTRQLSRHYQMGQSLVKALDDLTLEVTDGEFLALVGTSGSGKSTLLNLIGGLDQPTSGTLDVHGRDLAKMTRDELSLHRRNTVGMIFQSFNLVPSMTASQNVSLALMFAGVPRTERDSRASALLEAMGLADRQHHRPKELQRDGKTVILVTHDAALAATCARRTVTLLDGHVISDTGGSTPQESA